MLPPDCFPKIADWIDIYIYIVSKETESGHAIIPRKKNAGKTCRLFINYFVDRRFGKRENIENIRRNVEILASVRMFLTVDKKVSICIVLLKIILNKIN